MSVPHCHIERLDVPLGQPRPSLAIPPKSSPKETSLWVDRAWELPRAQQKAAHRQRRLAREPARAEAQMATSPQIALSPQLLRLRRGQLAQRVDMLASTQKFGRASRGREYKVSTSWRGLQQYQGLGSRLMALPIANSAEFNTSIQSLQP